MSQAQIVQHFLVNHFTYDKAHRYLMLCGLMREEAQAILDKAAHLPASFLSR